MTKQNLVMKEAKERAVCYGCDGEQPINPGDMILMDDNVTGGEVFCIRCAVAIAAKRKYCKTAAFLVKRGELRYEKLANAFRKRWVQMIKEVHEAKDDPEKQREAARRIMAEYEIQAPKLDEPVKHVEPEKVPEAKPQRKTRLPKSQAQRDAEGLKKAGNVARKLRKVLAELTSANFAVKVALQEAGGNTSPCDKVTAKKMVLDALCEELEKITKRSKSKKCRE